MHQSVFVQLVNRERGVMEGLDDLAAAQFARRRCQGTEGKVLHRVEEAFVENRVEDLHEARRLDRGEGTQFPDPAPVGVFGDLVVKDLERYLTLLQAEAGGCMGEIELPMVAVGEEAHYSVVRYGCGTGRRV